MRFLRQSLKLQILRLFQARSSLTFRQLFTLKRLSDMIITYSQMHHTGKFSKHSPIIWPVWLNDWMFAYKLSGCGFESYCSLFFICDIFIIWIWGTQVHIPIQIWFLKVSSRPEIPDVLAKLRGSDFNFWNRWWNSLKLTFTNIRGLRSNFVDCESFLESNSPDILVPCETNLDDSIDSRNFSVRGYLPLVGKDSDTHMHGLAVYGKEGLPFARDLSLHKTLHIFTYVSDWLYFT